LWASLWLHANEGLTGIDKSSVTCGGYFDMRDLGQVMGHEGPLPHPAQDRPQ
jgi:hypothetical protein